MSVERKLKVFVGGLALAIVLGLLLGFGEYASNPKVLGVVIGLLVIGLQWATTPDEGQKTKEISDKSKTECAEYSLSASRQTQEEICDIRDLISQCKVIRLNDKDYLCDKYDVWYGIDGKTLVSVNRSLKGRYIVPRGVEHIPVSAFWGQQQLNELILPESIRHIGEYAFAFCTALERVQFAASGFCTVEYAAFFECTKLREVTLPFSAILPSSLFAGCRSLERVVLPNELRFVKPSAFKDCISLKELVCSSPFIHIDEACILNKEQSKLYTMWNQQVTEYRVPNTVKEIAKEAFAYHLKLCYIVLPEGLEMIEPHTFEQCVSLEAIKLHEGIRVIGVRAFSGCLKLKALTLPNSLRAIGYGAFSDCELLRSIRLPEHIEVFEGWCFAECTALEEVYMPAELFAINYDGQFENCPNLRHIYVTRESYDFYLDRFPENLQPLLTVLEEDRF